MGRRKQIDRHLPVRMRLSHGAFYHVVGGKWSRIGSTYAEALLEYAKREAARSGQRNVTALITAFIAAGGRAATTQKNYRVFRKKLDEVFGHMAPADLKLQDARQYLDKRNTSMGRHEIQLLSAALSWGAERGWLSANPLMGMNILTGSGRPLTYTILRRHFRVVTCGRGRV